MIWAETPSFTAFLEPCIRYFSLLVHHDWGLYPTEWVGFPLHAQGQLNWSVAELGTFLAGSSLLMIFAQGPGIKWLNHRFKPNEIIVLGALLLAVGFALLFSNNRAMLYLANVFISFGNGIMWPSFMALLAQAGPTDSQGAVQGYASSMGSLASVIGLVLGGVLYTSFGASVFLLSAVIFLVIVWIQRR